MGWPGRVLGPGPLGLGTLAGDHHTHRALFDNAHIAAQHTAHTAHGRVHDCWLCTHGWQTGTGGACSTKGKKKTAREARAFQAAVPDTMQQGSGCPRSGWHAYTPVAARNASRHCRSQRLRPPTEPLPGKATLLVAPHSPPPPRSLTARVMAMPGKQGASMRGPHTCVWQHHARNSWPAGKENAHGIAWRSLRALATGPSLPPRPCRYGPAPTGAWALPYKRPKLRARASASLARKRSDGVAGCCSGRCSPHVDDLTLRGHQLRRCRSHFRCRQLQRVNVRLGALAL